MNNLAEDIENIRNPFEQFSKRIVQIQKYVQMIYEQKEFIEKFRSEYRETDEFLVSYVDNMADLANSTVLYNAAIISIYGSYEMFLNEVFTSYLEYLQMHYSEFALLPNSLKEKQIGKSVEFIGNPNRFLNYEITLEQVVNNLHRCVNENDIDALTSALLISHSGNMNSKQLENLFGEFGIKNAISLLKKNRKLKEFSLKQSLDDEIVKGQDFQILNTIVEARNSVAHGWVVDSRISFWELLEKELPFVLYMCEAISELLISKIIEDYIMDKKLKKFEGKIKTWESGTIVGINNQEAFLRVGDFLYYEYQKGLFVPVKILELKNKKKNRKYIRKKNIMVSMLVDKKIKENGTLYYWEGTVKSI